HGIVIVQIHPALLHGGNVHPARNKNLTEPVVARIHLIGKECGPVRTGADVDPVLVYIGLVLAINRSIGPVKHRWQKIVEYGGSQFITIVHQKRTVFTELFGESGLGHVHQFIIGIICHIPVRVEPIGIQDVSGSRISLGSTRALLSPGAAFALWTYRTPWTAFTLSALFARNSRLP